jgi:uncharacterized protein YceK
MKKILLAVVCICFLSGCSVFKRKSGCPTDGKSIGAEKILSSDKKSAKAVRKAKKFNS